VRETPEKEKSSRLPKDKEFKLTWRSLDRNNSKKQKEENRCLDHPEV
jgi:hypothetical protein